MSNQSRSDAKTFHLVGIGVSHSIAPPMHNHIAKSLGFPWTFYATECQTVEDLVELARKDTTAGLVVTMPFKNAVMSHLDALDELSIQIGACNNVYRDPSDPSRLRGTNTDWLGIKGCLLERSPEGSPVVGRPALVVGAGGASRAAVYALNSYFRSSVIYVLNRDEKEVLDLVNDSQRLATVPKIVHVKSGQMNDLESPYYIVGTVPDVEAKSPEEIDVQEVLAHFLSRSEKGVLLDMCFKPRRTRTIKTAEENNWSVVEGTHVIGHQIEEQYRLWCGEENGKRLDKKGAWEVLREQAESSPGINF